MAHSSNLKDLDVFPPHIRDLKKKTVADNSLSRLLANVEDCKELEKAIINAE